MPALRRIRVAVAYEHRCGRSRPTGVPLPAPIDCLTRRAPLQGKEGLWIFDF